MAIDPSWDNFTNKLIPVRQVDRLVVWNEIMKAQAIELHGYDADAIRVAGAPQFDPHFRRVATPRDEFFRRIGADPSRKLIALTTTPRSLYRHHDHVLRALVPAIRRRRAGRARRCWCGCIRATRWTPTASSTDVPHVIIEKPFRDTVKVADGLAIDVMPENQRHLGDTLCYADVVVNVASTITHRGLHLRHAGREHLLRRRRASPYVQVGAPLLLVYALREHHVARTRCAWRSRRTRWSRWWAAISQTRRWIAAGRRQVVLDQCQFTDGRSAERVVQCVLDEMGAGARRRAAA